VLAVCLVAGVWVAWTAKPESIGDYLKLSLNRRSALTHADAIFRQRGLDPKSYIHATVLVNVTDPLTNEFLRERVGVTRLNEILSTQVPGELWKARYFRDSQPEEYAVLLKPDGSLEGVRHILAEEAGRASLTKDEAVARAEKFLREERKLDLSRWTLVESNSQKLPHRTDHTLTWQLNAPLDSAAPSAADATDHAYERIELVVRGDEVSDCDPRKPSASPRLYCTYIKIPDEWRRKRGELTLVKIVFGYAIPVLTIIGMVITVLIVFLKNLRSEIARSIPWKRFARWSLWGLGGFVLALAFDDTIQAMLNVYPTAVSLKAMLGTSAIFKLVQGLSAFALLTLLFGVAWYYGVRAFGEERLPSWVGMPAAYYRDALLIGLGGTAGCMGLDAISKWISLHWPTAQEAAGAAFGANLDSALPAAAIIGNALRGGLTQTALVALAAAFIAGMVRPIWMRAGVFVLAVLTLGGLASNWSDPMDVAKKMVLGAMWIIVIDLAVRYLIRFNVLGYFLILASLVLVAGASELLGHPDHFYRTNGYGVLMALAALYIWPFFAWSRGTSVPAAS
jgi:hypothetical protein